MRGAEREVHDAGQRLASRGHRVDLVTGRPTGLTNRAVVDGVRVRYVRTPVPAALRRRGWRAETVFGGIAGVAAAVSRADVVLSYLYADAYGATLAKRLPGHRRRPVVLKLTGSVPRWWVADNRVERGLLRRALDGADEVWVNSRYVIEAMADWDRPMHVVPAGVDLGLFRPQPNRAPDVEVLCTAAADEPRKRVDDLIAAWPRVRARVPTATLLLAQSATDDTRRRFVDALPVADRHSVRFLGRLDPAALAIAYSRAWLTVAPAVHEALGLATVESLACGTPVVGADSGATPEVLEQPGTGVLYEPGDTEALADAVVRGVALSETSGVRDRCRASAQRYDWEAIIDRYEDRLGALTAD